MNLICRSERKEKNVYIYSLYRMFVQETGYLLRKRGGVNYTKRSSLVKRWMKNTWG